MIDGYGPQRTTFVVPGADEEGWDIVVTYITWGAMWGWDITFAYARTPEVTHNVHHEASLTVSQSTPL